MIDLESSQKLSIRNRTAGVLEIMVEMTPDRYLLQPGDEMEIAANLDGAPFSVQPYEGGLTIYPGNDSSCIVLINNVKAEADWSTGLPDLNARH